MSHPEPRIQCSNPQCAASNNLEALICDRCRTPIIKRYRYLWSSKKVSLQQKQTLVNDRYLALTEQIFLDTQPGKPPLTPEEVPPEIVIYLQLFAHYPHIPQPYGLLNDKETWLFDYGTVPANATGQLNYPHDLIPKIDDLWSSATSLKQLNWLWQIAKLWHPLALKGSASTLLNPDLIRINGQILQLLQLQTDLEAASLKDLGKLWTQWANNYIHPDIKQIVVELAANLETGTIARSGQLVGLLDRIVSLHCQSYQHDYQIYALSDSGPTRSNNEDAAYPLASQTQQTKKPALAIVCDGVGGHDGGEIASRKTIEYLQHKISSLKLEKLSSNQISQKLARYMNGANDIISKQNDTEQRQERQRMGTTLVMTLASDQEMYLSHVGDSRIYLITPNSCHQMTIDDDLASREVRLGYALYRDSLQYPSAGALIQALGMRDSAALHPNLRRSIVDDDCVFLLCTDGLSDFDRVEQQWRQKILPLLQGKQDIASAVKELIAFANKKNGHDNVTVALVHCQVKPSTNSSPASISWSDIEPVLAESSLWSEDRDTEPGWSENNRLDPSQTPTTIPDTQIREVTIGEPQQRKKQPGWMKPLIFILLISTIIGLFSYSRLRQNPDDYSPPSESNPKTDLEE